MSSEEYAARVVLCIEDVLCTELWSQEKKAAAREALLRTRKTFFDMYAIEHPAATKKFDKTLVNELAH